MGYRDANWATILLKSFARFNNGGKVTYLALVWRVFVPAMMVVAVLATMTSPKSVPCLIGLSTTLGSDNPWHSNLACQVQFAQRRHWAPGHTHYATSLIHGPPNNKPPWTLNRTIPATIGSPSHGLIPCYRVMVSVAMSIHRSQRMKMTSARV